ncbi:MAG: RDD family protein [Iamia sp.]
MAAQGFRIVTPEAVELDLDAAGLASRFLAILIDVVIMVFVLWALFAVAGLLGGLLGVTGADSDTSAILGAVLILVGTFAVLIVWPIGWEVATKGRSPGKMALGLRVVTIEGAPIRVRHALVRGLVALVEILLTLGVVAVVVALGSRRFRRLGDHLAGTVVIRERGAGGQGAVPRRFQPLPGWESWSAHLDTSRLTADDYRLVRSFLLRSRSLPLETRTRLGSQILVRVLGRAGLDPAIMSTLGTWSVDAPLLAVAAAYQRRFDPVAA